MRNVLEYLENASDRSGDEIRISDQNERCSYKQLMYRAKAAGSYLAGRNIRKSPVAVFMEKGIPALEAFFGIVYAGGFYVCINTRNPDNRVRGILGVCGDCLIITDKEHEEKACSFQTKGGVVLIEDIINTGIDEAALSEIRNEASPDDPLYSLFTSGSTGVPKGVLISHRCVLDFIDYFPDTFGITEKDVIGNQAPFDFDVSVKDIYSALKTGAGLVIIPTRAFALPNGVLDILCEEHVTVLIWAVSALCLISTLKGFDYKVPEDIRLVAFSGEAMPLAQLAVWQQHIPGAEYVNLYGPTEITCNSTYYRVDKDAKEMEVLPIGRAFPGRTVFLLDENDREITKCGVTGEICTGGTSLALGYYRNKEATDKAFTCDPVPSHGGGVIYRTGDLGYYDASGDLVFAGRKDFQIKHMGHRIELEEIERTLEKIPGVERAVCIYDDVKKRIHAFYLGDKDKKELRAEAPGYLPVQMMPSKWMKLDAIPMTGNGKADRKALKKMITEARK